MIVPPPRSDEAGAFQEMFRVPSPLVREIALGAPAVVTGVAVIVENAPWQTELVDVDIPAHIDTCAAIWKS